MSNNREQYWDDEDDDFEDTPVSFESETDLVKKLRKALKAEQRKNKELESSYADLSKSQKERIIKDVLASKGVDPKVAQFVPADIDMNADAIGAWLDNYSDVFGIKKEEKPAVPQQDINAMQRMERSLEGADPSTSDHTANLIMNAATEEDILSLIRGAQ